MARKKAKLDSKSLERLRRADSSQGEDQRQKLKPLFKFDSTNDPFILRNGNERMQAAKLIEIPNRLMGDFLFEQTVVMLFAETGVGKTLLAFQLANAISRGKSILGLENQSGPQTVLYVDMENGEKVFQSRYSESRKLNGKEEWYNEFDWDERCNFLDLTDPEKYEVPKKDAIRWWFELIKYKAEECGAKVIFIDNLFSIINEGGVESTKEAAPILKELLGLKKSKGWTVIVVHHTPKVESKKPITRNDLAGSSNLSNLVDGVIGIGKSVYEKDPHSRYIIQVKPTRLSPIKYGSNNVITCRTAQIEPNFIGFERIELEQDEGEYQFEKTHLGFNKKTTGIQVTEEEAIERRRKIKELIEANPKTPKTEIAAYVGTSRDTLYKDLKKIEQEQLFNNKGE